MFGVSLWYEQMCQPLPLILEGFLFSILLLL